MPAVVFTDTYSWAGAGTVRVTVDDAVPGYEGLYHWSYRLTNVEFTDGVGMFAIRVRDHGQMANLGSSVGWNPHVEPVPGPLTEYLVSWDNEAGAWPAVPTGESADFWFTTPVTAVVASAGLVSTALFGTGPGGAVAAPAPPIVVTTAADVVDGFDGQRSLREAITEVNVQDVWGGLERIRFQATLTGQTITLNPNGPTYGQLTLEKNVFIDGEDRGITIRRDPGTTVLHRIFEVKQNVGATLKGLTLRNGKVDVNPGGAVLARGQLTVESCTFAQNQAINSRGGAIATMPTAAGLVGLWITGSTFTGNNARLGGAIYIDEGVGTFIQSSFLELNTATTSLTVPAQGGGIYINSSTTTAVTTVTLDGVDVNGNSATSAGGGIYVSSSTGPGLGTWLTLKGSPERWTQVRNNQVTSTAGKGGGVYLGMGHITFNRAWFESNTATQGDGMYRVRGTTKQVIDAGVIWVDDQEFVEPD